VCFCRRFFDSICLFIVKELNEICISVVSRKYIDYILWSLKAITNVCGTLIVFYRDEIFLFQYIKTFKTRKYGDSGVVFLL
jgi:hypothetical protein